MLASDNKQLSDHAKTLQGPRTRGSTTEVGLDALPPDRAVEVVDVPDAVRSKGCGYYRVEAPELEGRLAAIAVKAALDCNLDVRVRNGSHGPELYAHDEQAPPPETLSPAAQRIPAHSVYLVLGPPDEYPGFPEGVLYTWHPGAPLAFLSPETGVKLL